MELGSGSRGAGELCHMLSTSGAHELIMAESKSKAFPKSFPAAFENPRLVSCRSRTSTLSDIPNGVD